MFLLFGYYPQQPSGVSQNVFFFLLFSSFKSISKETQNQKLFYAVVRIWRLFTFKKSSFLCPRGRNFRFKKKSNCLPATAVDEVQEEKVCLVHTNERTNDKMWNSRSFVHKFHVKMFENINLEDENRVVSEENCDISQKLFVFRASCLCERRESR